MHIKKPIVENLLIYTNPLFPSAVIARKSIIQKAGQFSIENIVEDFDLWLKIARISERFTYIPRSLGVYWINEKGRSAASNKMIMMLELVYSKHGVYLDEINRKES